MTSVEKRRSGRKSGGHRKHSDGGYSDTSSAGSFLDETDREVSNLTDRAFRSLCIGDEAVYNDSDLGASSPCTQRDRQLAFSQSAQDRDREREELKRAAHESFSLRMQQYGQEWIHGGMYGAEIQRDPQWEVYGERTQGRVSATFQHSFVETSQQEEALRGEQLSFLSNGATEVSSQQRRSRSRVSSLIRAFNSEGQRDGAVMDGKLREWNDDTSWDKSALMSIQRELSELSTSYQDNFNSGHFPSAGQFSSQNSDFYSTEVAAMSHTNSGSSFIRSSHSKHSMSAEMNCNSNFFIHSEFSPFKVWRDHNRFPFQQGEVSGFMHYPDFPKWYETPMYKELSVEAQPQVPYRFDERGMRHLRNNLAPVVAPNTPRATSTSTMLQRAVEKRCDSELPGQYPYRKRAQSLGANRLPSQRPSTASPTVEMSRRVQDTISSVRALQQKIKMMTEENMSAGMPMTQHGVPYSNDNLIPYGTYSKTEAPNVVSSNTSTTPFNISQLLTPAVRAHQEVETLDIQQHAVSPQLVEHAPVRAESRGATPDIRMSSYKSRATSLLFNLKDNRKRVKSTYSPPRFKGLEPQEKNKQSLIQESSHTVIDMPDFPDADVQYPQVEGSNWTNAASHHYVNQYHSSGSTNYEPATTHTGPYSEYTSGIYQTAQMQGEMVHHSGFTGFIPENYTSNQLANGQNLYEDLSSFTPYKQGMMDNVVSQRGVGYGHKPSYTATDIPRLNVGSNQSREYLINMANTEQNFAGTMGRADGYQQLTDNSYDYSHVSSQDIWRQTNNQDLKSHSLNEAIPPWAQEIKASMEKGKHRQGYQRAAMTNEELYTTRHRGENLQNTHQVPENNDLVQVFGDGASYAVDGCVNSNVSNRLPQYGGLRNNTEGNQAHYGYQQPGAFKDKYTLQNENRHNKEKETEVGHMPKTFNRYPEEHQHALYLDADKTGQTKQYTPIPNGYEMQNPQPAESKPQFKQNMQNNANPDDLTDPTTDNQAKDRKFDEVKAEQTMAGHVKAQHAQAKLAVAQDWAKEQQPKEELAGLNLAEQTGPETVKEEQKEGVNQASTEHVEEKSWDNVIEQLTEKQPEETRDVKTKAELPTEQKVTEPSYITEEAGAEHMKKEQDEQVKVKQAEAERVKEDHTKTELAETEQARIEQTKAEDAKRERIKAEQLETEKLRAEQAERERTEAEQIREKVKAEQAEAERQKLEQEELQKTEKQAEAEKEKGQVDDTVLIKEVVEEREIELETPKQTKANITETEQNKAEMVHEESAKPAPKLTLSQPVKREPDKVEQAKTELAKAKAELAKIKEKMKVKNTVPSKDDEVKRQVPATIEKEKNNDNKDQDQLTKIEDQQSKDLFVTSRQSSDLVYQGLDEYNRLREKYGFTDTPIMGTKTSAAEYISSKDANETPVLTRNKSETKNKEKSKDEVSSESKFIKANSEIKDEVRSFQAMDGTESQYIYSESSKEFKLSSSNNIPTNPDSITKMDSLTYTVKEDRVEKLETQDSLMQPDVSPQKDSNSAIQLPLERKPKSTEHSLAPSKDTHSNPPRALSHKERAQTKQEILTSKIKAHAEKEISAIKEKGYAKREGLMSKTSNKQLGGSQIISARQKPPSQEAPKKHDNTMSSNITPKHQMEPEGIQMAPVESASSSTSATIPVKSAMTNQTESHSQKVHKEPMNENVPKPTKEGKQTGIHHMEIDYGLVESQNKETQASTQSKEQATNNQQGQHDKANGENSRNKTDGLKNDLTDDTVNVIKEKEAKTTVEAKKSQPTTNKKAESNQAAVLEDSAPTLCLVLGQNTTPTADDNLQIRGIMVTIRERKPSLSNDEMNTSDQSSNSELHECRVSSHLEASKGDTPLKESTKVETKDKVVQSALSTMTDDKTKVGMKIYEETLAKRETQLQEPLAEKGSPSTVPAKNKTLAETLPLLHNQDIIPGETKELTYKTPPRSMKTDEVKTNTQDKNVDKKQTAHVNEKLTSNVINDHTDISNKADTESNIETSMKDDVKAVLSPTSSKKTEDSNASLLEEKKHHSTPVNNNIPSNTLTDKEVRQEENIHLNNDVHIDSIAIRVVPAAVEDYTRKAENQHPTADPSVGVAANEYKQVASSIAEAKLKNEDGTKDFIAASSQKQPETNLENNLSVHHVLSSVRKLPDPLKNNSQQEINATSKNTEANTGKYDSGDTVDESKIPPTEEDYFQVQGIAKVDHKLDRKGSDGNTSHALSERKELPRSLSNMGVSNKDSNNEGQKEVYVLDQSLRKIAESKSASIQEEDMKKNNRETEDSLASKHSDGLREKHSTTNEKSEAGQAINIRKHHSENRSNSRERHSQRNSNPTRENTETEKPEVKPTPKPRVSTIPEISALADYARLKVIVSEDRENTIQEFPPNKKEGFFPLIQSRHSRRPVFTTDPQDFTVKEKTLPNKTEVSSKVNKEPKPLVFPITEKEHQRTGMFKLGDKERQDKLPIDAKANAQHIQRIKSPTTQLKKEIIEEEVSSADTKRVHQAHESIHQSNNQAPNSSSAMNRPRNSSVSQQINPGDNSSSNEKHQQFSPTADRIPYLDKSSHQQPTLVQGNNTEESTEISRRDQKTVNVQAEKDGSEKLRQDRAASKHEDTMAKQQNRAKMLEEEHTATEEKKKTENMKIKHIVAESRASLAEEQRKAAKREEERRAREREAIANQIKERWDKQKDSERKTDEDRKIKKTGQEAHKEEEMRAKLRQEEEKRVKEIREKWQQKADKEIKRQLEQQRQTAQEADDKRVAQEEQQRRAAQEEQQRRGAAEEERQRRAAQKELQKKASTEEQQSRRAMEELQQRKAAQDEQQRRKAAEEERQERAAQEEQQRREATEEERRRRAAEQEQQRRAQEDQQRRRAAEEVQQKKAAQEEHLRRKAAEEERQRRAAEERQRRAAEEEQMRRKAVAEERKRGAAEEENQRRKNAEEEGKRKAAEEDHLRKKVAEEERQRRATEERQRRAAEEDHLRRKAAEEERQRKAAEERQRRAAEEDHLRRKAAEEERQRKTAEEEHLRKKVAEEERQRRAAEERQRRSAEEENLRRKAAEEERQRRAAEEEHQRRKAAEEERQRRAAEEEHKRRKAAQQERQRRAAEEEHQRRKAVEEERQRRGAEEENQRRTAEEEQQRRRAAQKEKERRAAQDEQLRRKILEEEQGKAAKREQERRAAQEEQQRRASHEEQQKRAPLAEQQRRAAKEEQKKRAAEEEKQRRAEQEEKQRRATLEQQHRRAEEDEQEKRAALEKQQRRAVEEEQQRRAAHEDQQWRAALIEEQRQAKQIEEKILNDIEKRKKQKHRELEKAAQNSEQERIKQMLEQNEVEQHTDKQRERRQKKDEKARVLEENQAVLKEDNKVAQEHKLVQEDERERRMDALQYYALTSTDSERKEKDRELFSPSPPQQRHNPVGLESSENSESLTKSYRPQASASPAPSLSRSNASSPALGVKPLMFRVKDNTFRSSSFTKSVKPRFHKNFGEDYRVGSPMERGSERGEEEQEIVRHSAGTPIHADMGLNRLAAIRESPAFQSAYSSQDYSAHLPQRPYSRRSIALDEDDSRSVISNMSEGMESFATSAADLSELRGLYYDERPESACSFSSDVSRSLGKPPAVPPKSEKALRRAKRLTSRRINKEMSKVGTDSPAGVEKSHQEVSGNPPSSSTEVRSSNRHVVASPHFTPPVSLTHAPTVESSLPSSHSEHQSSHSSFHASPHATGPISLPVATPHATAPVSLPVVSTHATAPASHTAAPRTVAHTPSSPTLHHANHPAPVTQYQVESSYPQSYPMTQRKVLQDLGSGQYFVVDVPVQVKTKTFIDPETGKYVQLNVRETAQSTPRPQRKLQPQQAYHQPQLQPKMQAKPQQQSLSQASPAGKPVALYEGYHGYSQGYQPAANKSIPHHRSAAPATPHQEQQSVRDGPIYGYPAPEIRQNPEGPRYSPEKTPYMDTVNDSGKTYNTVYNTHGPYESFPECDTNSQLAGSPVCENDNSAHPRYQPREIITISELEDFMEVSDW
ncbi:uncharacterized protein LOC121511115 [Cheilinus undulatus]|uniref:uncharacterized protein LOC121511115 n=1 Tax=Cheilinus undulatus TaxID=241271 RepID=UPI001BD4645B|nr:uncharacterized protein LOC121511115 [Cheilinus undulatus]